MIDLSNRSRGSLACALLAATIFSSPAFAGTLAGTVLDASGTGSLQGAELVLKELGRRTNAGPDGAYRFADVPAGSYTLVARYAGAEDYRADVNVAPDGITRSDVRLSPAAGGATILVVGQQANLGSSISRQRAADGVENVLTRDAVGQFPDQNVAEALRRAPGINVLNDQGEGRFVSVRGLDPNLNAASINGTRVPAPESDVRSVALDVIPSELVESIEIKKTLTPDMDADTIGASIEINTTSAFDRKKPFVSVSAEGSFNDKTNELRPKGSVDFATRIGDDFGISGGLSYYKRRFATDNIEAEGWDEDDGVRYFEKLEYRDYDVTRERLGGSLSLDWRPSDTTTLFARGLYSRFEDQEFRKRLIFDVGDAKPIGGTGTRADFVSGEDDDEIKVERDLKDRYEVQKIMTYSIGGKTETGPWTFRYEGAYAKSSEKENGSIDPIAWSRDFDDEDPLGVTFDFANYKRPGYSITQGGDIFFDPEEYEFDKVERTTLSLSKDREWSGRFDVTRDFALARGEFSIQAGGKARLRRKTYDLQKDIYEDNDTTLAEVLGKQDYSLALIDPVPGYKPVRKFLGNGFDQFTRNDIDSDFESAASDYRVDEDIYAGYLLGRYEDTRLRVVGGVRVEHTKNDIRDNLVELIEEGADNGDDLVEVSPLRFKRSYTDVLPSAAVRYQPARDVVLRLGAFKSVVRPTIGKLAPRFLIEESDDGEREGEFGNPALKPYRAWNIDVAAEYYFARNAVVQAGFFWKDIKDFIVDRNHDDPGVFNGIAYDEATIPENGDSARVKGIEFSFQQAFTFLPAPFDGLLANFNYTYTDADGRLADGRKIPLPSSAKNTFNVALGYDKGPISFRVAGTYRDSYLDELGDDADEDRIVTDHFQVDVSAKYRVTKQVQLFVEWVNLFNEPYTAYQRGPLSRNLLQYEEYGWTAKFGAKATF